LLSPSRPRILGTGKTKRESWKRREGQTEEENRAWWLANLSSKGKGIQVSKVGHSNTGSAGNILVIHNRTLRINSRSVDQREIRERERAREIPRLAKGMGFSSM